ncbi:MAG: alkyl hydroperoxide reductase subunit F [Bifidobacteriaceae bacterium]|jgi:alkyl hydroperoxide reductase subunit F|nr:alkyl hydroperoxide reductase subunit F [Bifidobacteriaceae bacterium]
MLETSLLQQLKGLLGNLEHPIELVAALDESEASRQTRELLDEVAAQSPLVTVREDGPDALDEAGAKVRRPSFLITEPGKDSGVRFAGLPMGHEFTSLVLALLHVGGHAPKEDADLLAAVKALPGPLHFETYFSTTCHNCPDVVQALNIMSALNPAVSHTAIEGGQFKDEVESKGVMSVPTVFLNGQLFDTGRMTLEDIVRKLAPKSADAELEALSRRDPYDVLVVGGGPAGATAAMYAARKGIRVGLLAEVMGGQVLDTAGIENFPSVKHIEGTDFAAGLESHCQEYGVEIVTGHRAAGLVPAADGGPVTVPLEGGGQLQGKAVIIAVGAKWRDIGVPGEVEYRKKGVTYCPHCDGPLFKGKPVAVIGGGNSGIEAAIDMAGLASKVTVLEFLDQLKADKVLLDKAATLSNVTIVTSAATTEVVGDGAKVTALRYKDRADDAPHEIPVAGVFVQIGLKASTDWLKDSGLELTPRGEIPVDVHGATSLPGVFAGGDCTTQPYKQVVISCGSGATAALGAFDYLMRA